MYFASQSHLFASPLNLILYLLRAGLRYREDFCEITRRRGGGERETEKETDTGVQIGRYSNRRDVSEKRKKKKKKQDKGN